VWSLERRAVVHELRGHAAAINAVSLKSVRTLLLDPFTHKDIQTFRQTDIQTYRPIYYVYTHTDIQTHTHRYMHTW
jgi:hypothetical protein